LSVYTQLAVLNCQQINKEKFVTFHTQLATANNQIMKSLKLFLTSSWQFATANTKNKEKFVIFSKQNAKTKNLFRHQVLNVFNFDWNVMK
jgi:hypothetical protein